MAKDNHELLAFNRGVISPLVFARADVPRVALSAEIQTNWLPRALGAMSLRPGFGYLGATYNGLLYKSRFVPFVYANNDTAGIEVSNGVVRIWVDDAAITYPAITAAFTNGAFATDLTGWTDSDETGGVSSWLTGGYLSLVGDGVDEARRDQLVICNESGTEHAVGVRVTRGPVIISVGSTLGGVDYLDRVELQTGYHILAFTPTGNFYVRLAGNQEYPTLVDAVVFHGGGDLELPAPWFESDLPSIRYTQSGDVIFVACTGFLPRRIERHAARSWSLVEYVSNYGPFRLENLTTTTLAPSALNGVVTLTASKPVFQPEHVGALFRITSTGQTATQDASAADTYSDSILITGTGDARALGLTLTGTWAGTVTLQRSVGAPDAWVDVTTFTANASTTLDDALDNQVIYYRIGVKAGEWTSGTVTMTITTAGGSITGIARITAYTSATSATAIVLKDFGALTATDNWAEGAWSEYRGYPSACRLREGRLWFAGKDKFWASVVDDYTNHDPEYLGDAGPISRSIGDGPVDSIRWLASVDNLLAGGEGREFLARSSVQEEPMTPSNFNLRGVTGWGSTDVDALVLDNSVMFVDSSTTRLMELVPQGNGYLAGDLTLLTPELTKVGIVALAAQRRPDTRVHCVLADGTVALLVYNPVEDVRAWVKVETNGYVEDAFVLPGTIEDAVYYVVRRTIGGNDARYLEKWAQADECIGGLVTKLADSFVYSTPASATITGLSHLEGETVVCWADGVDQGTFTVTGGAITLPASVDYAVVGLAYTAQFKSTKLASTGLALIKRKRITHLGVLLTDTHAQGLTYGPDFDNMDDMPMIEAGVAVDQDGVWARYNYDHISFSGSYTVDSRLCLSAAAPRPATVLAAIIEMEA